MNRIFRWIVSSLFAPVTSNKGAVASSLGFILGLVPLYVAKLPLLFALSIIFRLNILSIILGMAIPIFIPFIRDFAFICSHWLEGYSFSQDSIKFWLFTPHQHYHDTFSQFITGITASTFGLLTYPLFLWFYNLGIKKRETHQEHIFLDPTKQRWSIIKRMSFGFIALMLVVSIIFIESINTNPLFPELHLNGSHARAITPIFEKIREEASVKILKYQERKHPDYQLDFKRNSQIKRNLRTGKQEVYGFYVNWDENSKASLKQNINSISVLVPEWLHVTNNLTFTKETDPEVVSIAKAHRVKILPLINNYINNNWDGAILHRLFSAPGVENQFITNMLDYVKTNGFSGINIDFEAVNEADKNNLTHFVQKVSTKFHQQGLTVTIDVPPGDNTFDYSALANMTDRLIVMLYDENSAEQSPGPIASNDWFNQSLNNLNIPSNKLVISLGSYGYDWMENSGQPAETLSFGDIMDMGLDTNLYIQWDKNTGNPYIRYKENGDNHIIWFLDAATFHNQLQAVTNSGAKGVAIWRLGSEDPSIWKLLYHPNKSPSMVLKHLTNPNSVNYTGAGEVLRIVSTKVEGIRTIHIDSNGIITNEAYTKFPKPFNVVRFGKPKTKEVVLSFDDGPDPVYTPKILDILDRYHIKGAFFIVGVNAELHPEIIERMYKEGHEIGSHTFTHPNVASISPIRTKMELNANQRLFQEITGHSMTLFRAPYVADAEPSTTNELLPILRAQNMGYTMVGELIDPSDWQRPPSDVIVRRVLNQLPTGNIILLHDAGGNRSNTIKALPIIIKDLKERGYTFTTIGHLIEKSHSEIMPAASKDLPYLVYDKAVFNIMQGWHDGVGVLLYSAIIIGLIRLAFLVYMSRRQVKRYKEIPFDLTFTPFVSVVIAAYNEEKVIKKTVDSILASDYPAFEILVVDDGSKDNTAAIVREAYLNKPLVHLISKDNGGKSSAVNLGFKEAKGEIVVALDADTLIADNAISLLVRHFKDEHVAAVSGNVKVGNKRNLLTKWQHIEYVTGFNLERRAFSELNCITVVPGAIGAWRKKTIEAAGYFMEDTLAEDTDITLTLLRQGHKIEFEEKAYAFTEVPEDVKSLAKQRYRWTYGTLQCLWKHRESLFSKAHSSLGYIGLPNMWLYQYIYQTISPIADILFILALFGSHPGKATIGFIVFYLIDFLTALYSFHLEREDPKPLVHLFLQRILYKQLMTYIVIKSILSAIRGIAVDWNKLKRNGNVIQKVKDQSSSV